MSTRNIIIALVVIGAIVAVVVGYRRQRARMRKGASAAVLPLGGSTVTEPQPTQVVESGPTELQKMRYASSSAVRPSRLYGGTDVVETWKV